MTSSITDTVQRKTARIAGLLYLAFAVISIVVFLPTPLSFSTLVVSGDAAATANNIASSEGLVRANILGTLISQIMFIFLVLILYRLFKEIDQVQALLMVIFVAIGVTATFVNTLNKMAALTILGGDSFLSVFDRSQLDALAYLFIRLHSQSSQAIQIFWGLWLFPFGFLVYKSRFIPNLLGILLTVAGFAYLLSSSMSLVFPQYKAVISPLISFLEMGELPIIFWLLIVGTKAQTLESSAPLSF